MPDRRKTMRARRIACAGAAFALCHVWAGGDALAQDADTSVSYPVVQPLPSPESLALNAALSRLGRNPRDVAALVDAGNSALAMGDVDAAFGFFQRADQVSAGNPRVKAGLASAMVQKGQPVKAIALFDEAELAGASASELAADRGLAYDLVGDNAAAQRYYRLALQQGENHEVTRRLALSLAISGDREEFEQLLMPLLREQDKAAWRTRAFGLAILGKADGAVHITGTMLPEALAAEIAPYLRYMPRLTRAQQAAAANFGTFPRASEIGRDDPEIARLSEQAGRRAATTVAEAGFSGEGALTASQPRSGDSKNTAKPDKRSRNRADIAGADSRKSKAAAKDAAVRTVPPEPRPARQPGAASEPVLAAAPKPVRLTAPTPAHAPAPAPTPAPRPTPAPAIAAAPAAQELPAAKPGFDLARLPSTQSVEAPATPAAPPPPQAGDTENGSDARVSLAEAFGDLGKPSDKVAPAAGAVDIRKITPAKPKPVKPPPPSHPSRIWVQLGVGRDTSALAYDWRRLTRKLPEQLKRQKAYVSPMGQTNRMLTGPFDCEAAGEAFIRELGKADVSGPYLWTSPAGQVVDSLQ